MAERKTNGHDWFLFIDAAGGTNYDTLICLTNKTINRTTSSIDASTQCGEDAGPGDKAADIGFEGVQVLDPDSGNMSGADLEDLWMNSTEFGWKLAVAVPASGDIIREGTGFITSLSDTYGDGRATFTGTFQITGNYTKNVES